VRRYTPRELLTRAKQHIEKQESLLKALLDDVAVIEAIGKKSGFRMEKKMGRYCGKSRYVFLQMEILRNDILKIPVKRCAKNLVSRRNYYNSMVAILQSQHFVESVLDDDIIITDCEDAEYRYTQFGFVYTHLCEALSYTILVKKAIENQGLTAKTHKKA
jgi:hypothetical protein